MTLDLAARTTRAKAFAASDGGSGNAGGNERGVPETYCAFRVIVSNDFTAS
ncbi:MAG: hypothetical protein K0S42_2901 [Microvirga sp.]|nr:hypothetical protein [Microvirga sp.]